jgi:hypothetical protein
MKQKVHTTKLLVVGERFEIVCNTPTSPRTKHAMDRRDVTCKKCLRLAQRRGSEHG